MFYLYYMFNIHNAISKKKKNQKNTLPLNQFLKKRMNIASVKSCIFQEQKLIDNCPIYWFLSFYI